MIPEGWRKAALKDICAPVTSGSRGWAQFYAEDGSPFIRITNLRRSSVSPDYSNLRFVRIPDDNAEGRRTQLKVGDILMSITADLGTIGFVDRLPAAETYISQHVARIRLKSADHDPLFLAYQMASSTYWAMIQRLNDSGAKAGLNLPTIAGLPVLLPHLPEQRRIAEILSTWDRALETVEALIANARDQKAALMQALLTGRTRLPGFVGAWAPTTIGAVCDQVTERAGSATDLPVLSCSKHDGFVESLKYFKKKVFGDDLTGYKVVRRGMIGFPTNHVEEGSIARQNIVEAGLVSPIYCVFRPRDVDGEFLIRLLKTDEFTQRFAAATNASVNRRGSLRWKEFSKLRFNLPPPDEQRAIAAVINDAEAKERALTAQRDALREEKAALMQQLLTGKRRAKVARGEGE